MKYVRNVKISCFQGRTTSESGDVRKWGSCSKLEYNSQQPSTYGQFSGKCACLSVRMFVCSYVCLFVCLSVRM